MPVLEWIGKEKVVNHADEVPFHVLERSYNYGAEDSNNKIIHGDNLVALKSLLPEYEGRVKCIYIDPPYNTGNEGWVYNDRVNDPRIVKWLGEVVGKEGEDLSRHDKWLCMMYPRLQLLQRLLAEDGFIFISIDVFEYANLKCILDEIFGSNNFRNCIAVRRGIKNVQAQFEEVQALSLGHEFVYLYSKSPQAKLPKLSKNFEVEKAGKWDTFWRGTDRPTMRYEIFGQKPNKGQWRWEKGRATKAAKNYERYLQETKERISIDDYYLEHLMATNEKLDFVRCNDINTVQYYIAPKSGKLLSDNWLDILLSGSYANFDTEKNVLLLERIIGWIADKDSIVLDSFAGSGTTAHAVLNLNKADGGNRKFILVEMMDYAESITAERVKRVIDGYGEGKKKTEGTGGGFSFYEVGEPLLVEVGLNEAVDEEKIRAYIWYTETRTPYRKPTKGSPAFLGCAEGTAVYFHYEKDETTTLDAAFLRTVKEKAERYVIYADVCVLAPEMMEARNIVFRKIPRDIRHV